MSGEDNEFLDALREFCSMDQVRKRLEQRQAAYWQLAQRSQAALGARPATKVPVRETNQRLRQLERQSRQNAGRARALQESVEALGQHAIRTREICGEIEQTIRGGQTPAKKKLANPDGSMPRLPDRTWEAVALTASPRCGDADRDRCLEQVTERYSHGYLTPAEFDARRTAILTARTCDELELLIRDLPLAHATPGELVPVKPRRTGLDWDNPLHYVPVLSGGVALGGATIIVPGVAFAHQHWAAWHALILAPCVMTGFLLAITCLITLIMKGSADASS